MLTKHSSTMDPAGHKAQSMRVPRMKLIIARMRIMHLAVRAMCRMRAGAVLRERVGCALASPPGSRTPQQVDILVDYLSSAAPMLDALPMPALQDIARTALLLKLPAGTVALTQGKPVPGLCIVLRGGCCLPPGCTAATIPMHLGVGSVFGALPSHAAVMTTDSPEPPPCEHTLTATTETSLVVLAWNDCARVLAGGMPPSLASKVDELLKFPLLRGLPPEYLKFCLHLFQERTLPPKTVLVQQGLPAGRDEELLLIISGEVSVTVDPSGLPTLLGASPKVPNQVAGAKQGPRRTTMAGTTSLGSVQVSRITAGGVIGEAAALACLLQVEWGTDLAAAQSPPDADEGQDMGVSSPVRFGRPLAADEVRARIAQSATLLHTFQPPTASELSDVPGGMLSLCHGASYGTASEVRAFTVPVLELLRRLPPPHLTSLLSTAVARFEFQAERCALLPGSEQYEWFFVAPCNAVLRWATPAISRAAEVGKEQSHGESSQGPVAAAPTSPPPKLRARRAATFSNGLGATYSVVFKQDPGRSSLDLNNNVPGHQQQPLVNDGRAQDSAQATSQFTAQGDAAPGDQIARARSARRASMLSRLSSSNAPNSGADSPPSPDTPAGASITFCDSSAGQRLGGAGSSVGDRHAAPSGSSSHSLLASLSSKSSPGDTRAGTSAAGPHSIANPTLSAGAPAGRQLSVVTAPCQQPLSAECLAPSPPAEPPLSPGSMAAAVFRRLPRRSSTSASLAATHLEHRGSAGQLGQKNTTNGGPSSRTGAPAAQLTDAQLNVSSPGRPLSVAPAGATCAGASPGREQLQRAGTTGSRVFLIDCLDTFADWVGDGDSMGDRNVDPAELRSRSGSKSDIGRDGLEGPLLPGTGQSTPGHSSRRSSSSNMALGSATTGGRRTSLLNDVDFWGLGIDSGSRRLSSSNTFVRSPTATAMESSGGQALIPRSHKSFTESVTPSLMAAAAVATAVTSSIGTGSSQLLRAPLSAHLPGAGSGSRTQGSMLSTRSSTTTPGQPQTATYSPTNLTTGSRVLAQASVVVMGSKPRRSSGYSSGSFSASQLLPDLLSPTRKQPAAPA